MNIFKKRKRENKTRSWLPMQGIETQTVRLAVPRPAACSFPGRLSPWHQEEPVLAPWSHSLEWRGPDLSGERG